MSLPPVVLTERLVLPLWSGADVAALRAGRRLATWHRDFPRRDDLDAASLWHDGDPWGPRSIVRGTTVLGSIGFFGPPEPSDPPEQPGQPEREEPAPPEAEVGYGLVAEARGWGFATEALRALLVCTDAAGVRIRASVLPTNKAGVRVLAKCRFTELRGSDEEGQLVMARPLPVATTGG